MIASNDILGLQMKLNTYWALPVYPVLKDQIHENCVKTSYKKLTVSKVRACT